MAYKCSGIVFGKAQFLPVFHPFLVSMPLIFSAFGDFPRAKTGDHRLKTG